ncbi:hypothetical protein FOPE_01911 [Fonsecaea pedrosoi]|nr:hypothetical protein FOPE_01911 [Fonsecaea pedrosoi]
MLGDAISTKVVEVPLWERLVIEDGRSRINPEMPKTRREKENVQALVLRSLHISRSTHSTWTKRRRLMIPEWGRNEKMPRGGRATQHDGCDTTKRKENREEGERGETEGRGRGWH